MKPNSLQLPSIPSGRIQRGKPKAFARPSINLGGAEPGQEHVAREWRSVPAHAIAEGDNVPGLGVIEAVIEHTSAPAYGSGLDPAQIADAVQWTVTLAGAGDHRMYRGNEMVFAFTAKA